MLSVLLLLSYIAYREYIVYKLWLSCCEQDKIINILNDEIFKLLSTSPNSTSQGRGVECDSTNFANSIIGTDGYGD